MKLRLLTDPFREKQPSPSFLEELTKPLHQERIPGWNGREPAKGEVFFTRVTLAFAFPDPEGLLLTAYEDFSRFLTVAGSTVGEDGFRLKTEQREDLGKEEYIITVEKSGCTLSAADTEGIRRALIYLEDECMRREGCFLPLGQTRRAPFIRWRISRCFFTPPSHASNEGMVNELASDMDYYPDEYLNRLAHDGINALWLGASFKDLLPSTVIPEYGHDSERRLQKLSEVVEKCRRYGIAIFLFGIEPASTFRNELLLNTHPELLGGAFWGEKNRTFCLSTEGGRAYLKEAIRTLFKRVPKLAGLLQITAGEHNSSCGSVPRMLCERCREKHGTVGRTLADAEKLIYETMKEVAPEADFISWTYGHRAFKDEDILDSCDSRHPGVIHMQNMEDYTLVEQLGKKRLATDYWLSVTGPGKIMAESLEVNRRRGIETFAKIQACSSHEISTVPYVPVPGILYDKYQYMYENGITGVLQCWYFGNYPCLMNKAASELSFLPFFESKRAFLYHLASIYWGRYADTAVTAWLLLEEGYRNFPVSVSFEWLGPMQDSPCAPLRLLPADLPMPSTWLLRDPTGGDRLGECLTNGHTLEEALTLCREMSRLVKKGAAALTSLPNFGYEEKREQQSCVRALDLIFESGCNILEFYRLRRELGIGKGDPLAVLGEMEEIAHREIEISDALIPLCQEDPRIGYHSEAHGYKIFPEKLSFRIEEVRRVLAKEFPLVKERIEKGLVPIPFYAGEEDGLRVLKLARTSKEAERFPFLLPDGSIDEKTTVSGYYDGERVTLEFSLIGAHDSIEIKPEFRVFFPTVPFSLCERGILMQEDNGFSFFGEKVEQEKRKFTTEAVATEDGILYRLSFLDREFGREKGEPFRLSCRRTGEGGAVLSPDDRQYTRLIHGEFSPDAYALFLL